MHIMMKMGSGEGDQLYSEHTRGQPLACTKKVGTDLDVHYDEDG